MRSDELYALIGLPIEIIQKLKPVSQKTDLEQIDSYLKQMMDIKTAAESYGYLNTLFAEDTDHIKMLYCQLECARRIFEQYQKKQIPKTLYAETMKCFSRFINECEKKNGRMFFDRGWWTYRQISMSLFRIGTLEYEFLRDENENVIGIHIPSDADLSKEAVDRSLTQAELFFQTYYREYEYKKFTCHSWLLSPVLKSLLSEQSNILSFQNRFTLIQEDKEDNEYIEWLFQVPIDTDHKNLPENTSLQKKVKELLLHGKTLGSAYGIINVHS